MKFQKTARTQLLTVRAKSETHDEVKRLAVALNIPMAQVIEDWLVLLTRKTKAKQRAE